MPAVSESLEMESERLKEAKCFLESKMGVKGLVDSGATTIPRIFRHPPESLSDLKPSVTQEIPIIDFSTKERGTLVNQVRDAFSSWGIFQVINHGIPIQVVDDTIKAFKSFHEEAVEVKKSRYVWDEKVEYYTNINILTAKGANWKDTIRVLISPDPPEMEAIPFVCRKELMEWDLNMKNLCKTVMELTCEGLGVDKNRLSGLSCLKGRRFLANYYPRCPQPDLTLGLPTHTDRSVMTLLLQNVMSGLQVKYGDQWVEVKPVHEAIIVNAGDLLQVLSNDKIRSIEHRVLANPCKEPRVSIAIFFRPGKENESDWYGPLPELVSLENPALYRNFNIPDIEEHGKRFSAGVKPLVNLFKLKP